LAAEPVVVLADLFEALVGDALARRDVAEEGHHVLGAVRAAEGVQEQGVVRRGGLRRGLGDRGGHAPILPPSDPPARRERDERDVTSMRRAVRTSRAVAGCDQHRAARSAARLRVGTCLYRSTGEQPTSRRAADLSPAPPPPGW